MSTTAMIVLAVLVLLLVWTISLYNNLVRKKNYMSEAWSGIDVFLKKRYDLLPNLVETVKGYAAHEKKVLDDLTAMRTQAMQAGSPADKMQSEQGLSRALGSLMAVAENYPDLKASANFQQLQKDLYGIESELESARRYYNATVRENNMLIEGFPSGIIANLFHFQKGVFFELDKNADYMQTPKVSF